jgi:hypothetical protein
LTVPCLVSNHNHWPIDRTPYVCRRPEDHQGDHTDRGYTWSGGTVPANWRCYWGGYSHRCPKVATRCFEWREGPNGNHPRREQLCDAHAAVLAESLVDAAMYGGRRDVVRFPHTNRPIYPDALRWDPAMVLPDAQLAFFGTAA